MVVTFTYYTIHIGLWYAFSHVGSFAKIVSFMILLINRSRTVLDNLMNQICKVL